MEEHRTEAAHSLLLSSPIILVVLAVAVWTGLTELPASKAASASWDSDSVAGIGGVRTLPGDFETLREAALACATPCPPALWSALFDIGHLGWMRERYGYGTIGEQLGQSAQDANDFIETESGSSDFAKLTPVSQ